MLGKKIFYRRVSASDQNLDRQSIDEPIDRIFEEKISGKNLERPVLQECLAYLRDGDTLFVYSIDRLCRNLQDLLKILELLMAKGVTLVFQKEHLTFTPGKDDPFQSLQLQIIGCVAEFERNMIKSRQLEGIRAAQLKGTRFGRPEKLTPVQKEEIRSRALSEEKDSLAQEYGVSRQTVYAVLKQGPGQEAANG